VDASRNVVCSTNGVANDLFSPPLAVALQALQSSTFHGGRSLQINAVTALDAATLSQADLLLVVNVIQDVTMAERMAINSFVVAGGGVVWFANDAGRVLQDVLGVGDSTGVGAIPALVADASSPMVSGPFGSLPLGTAIQHAYCYPLLDLGRHGAVAVDTSIGALAATFTLGAGRVALFGDEEVLMTTALSPCYANAWNANNSLLLRNSIDWVAPAPGFGFSNPPLADYGVPCDPMAVDHGVFGEPVSGAYLRFALRGAAPGQLCAFAVGTGRSQLPFLGCSLLVSPIIDTLYSVTGTSAQGLGRAAVEIAIPTGISGSFTSQAFVFDPGVPRGFTASAGAAFDL